jgi:hypothetical protein
MVILFFSWMTKKKWILAGISITKTGNYSTCFLKEGKKKKIFNQKVAEWQTSPPTGCFATRVWKAELSFN